MSPTTDRVRGTDRAHHGHPDHRPEVRPASLIHVEGSVVDVDQGALSLFGFERREDVLGRSLFDLVAPASLAAAQFRMRRTSAGQPMKSQELSVLRADGSEFLVEVTSSPTVWNGGRAGRVVLIPATAPATQLLHYATGVFSELSDAVIVADLHGHIRSWNNAAERLYGWAADEVIGQHIADIVPWEAGQADLTSSWASFEDEERRRVDGRHIRRDGSSVAVRSSTSVVRDEEGMPIGRVSVNRPVPHPPTSGSRPRATARERADIRRGLDHDEFVVHYQPVVDVHDGTVVGVEALARWNHPTHGLLQPGAFIEVAEEEGMIVELGGLILDMACRQAAAWRAEGADLELAVNLSAEQLGDDGLVDRVQASLAASGLDPHALWLEVTETALVHDIERASDALSKLAALGVQISIDDFGTGWASLTYLHHFPVHALKIDRVFVAGVTDSPSDIAIVKSIISLGHELGLAVIAEGVETVDQQLALIALGCTIGQGYLFGRPVPPECLPLGTRQLAGVGVNIAGEPHSARPPVHSASSSRTTNHDLDMSAATDTLRAVLTAQRELVAAGHDVDRLLATLAQSAMAVTGGDAALVHVPEGDEDVVRAAAGYARTALEGMRVPLAGSIADGCMRFDTTWTCTDAAANPPSDEVIARIPGMRSFIVVPFPATDRGRSAGVVTVSSHRPGAFVEHDAVALSVISGVAASALAAAGSAAAISPAQVLVRRTVS